MDFEELSLISNLHQINVRSMENEEEKEEILDQIPAESDKNLTHSLRKVRSLSEAESIMHALDLKGIQAKMLLDGGIVDPIFIGNAPQNKYEILVHEDDRQEAESIFWEWAQEVISEIPEDYHLFEYSDQDLIQILVESTEWNELDVLLAEKILRDRKVPVNFDEIDNNREQRKQELAKPQSGQTGWIVIGYLFAFLFGFVGMLLGYSLWKAKKRSPDGDKSYAYADAVRVHGKIIFFISIISFALFAISIVLSSVRNAERLV